VGAAQRTWMDWARDAELGLFIRRLVELLFVAFRAQVSNTAFALSSSCRNCIRIMRCLYQKNALAITSLNLCKEHAK